MYVIYLPIQNLVAYTEWIYEIEGVLSSRSLVIRNCFKSSILFQKHCMARKAHWSKFHEYMYINLQYILLNSFYQFAAQYIRSAMCQVIVEKIS